MIDAGPDGEDGVEVAVDGKLLTLQRSRVANGYSKPQLRALARLADVAEFSARQTLIAAGARRTGCLLLLRGSVVTATSDTVWLTSQAGTLVGLAETLADVAAAVDTVALSAGCALVFTPTTIRAAIDDIEPLRRAALTQLAVASLDRPHSRARFASALG